METIYFISWNRNIHHFKDLTHFSNISSIQSKNGNLGCRRFGLTLCYLFKKAEIVCNGCCRTSESPRGISLCYFYLSVIFPSWRNNKECYFSHSPFLHLCFILIQFLKSSTSLSANPSTTLWTFHWMKQWIINAIFCGCYCFGMIELVLYDNICQRSLSRCETIIYPEIINILQTNADLTLRWFKIR